MGLPTTEKCLLDAEEALGLRFAPAHRLRLLSENGGEVEAANDTWGLFPVQDISDRKRASRSANHIVRESILARKWPQFPGEVVAIAANGTGDYLVSFAAPNQPRRLDDHIFLWDHETGALVPVEVRWTTPNSRPA